MEYGIYVNVTQKNDLLVAGIIENDIDWLTSLSVDSSSPRGLARRVASALRQHVVLRGDVCVTGDVSDSTLKLVKQSTIDEGFAA